MAPNYTEIALQNKLLEPLSKWGFSLPLPRDPKRAHFDLFLLFLVVFGRFARVDLLWGLAQVLGSNPLSIKCWDPTI